MPVSLAPSSAAGLLALLDEPDPTLQQLALEQLDSVLGAFWPEVSEHIVAIETLSESPTLPQSTRELAALVGAKLYFHLGAEAEALALALRAGSRFELERLAVVDGKGKGNEGFVEVITAKALDEYIALRCAAAPEAAAAGSSRGGQATSAALEAILLSIVRHALGQGESLHALGLALESRRTDLVRLIWEERAREGALLRWVLEQVGNAGRGAGGRAFRVEVLELLLELIPLSTPAGTSTEVDYPSLLQIHLYLNRPSLSAALLSDLLGPGGEGTDERKRLWAYQVAFDLAEGATQEFLGQVATGLFGEGPAGQDEAEVKSNMRRILSGEMSIRLNLDFLFKNDRKDLLILKTTKDALESRSSMYHSALTLSHAFMSAGTTSDAFLRQNLDFLSRANNWSKFTATSALGVINKGSLSRGRTLLGPYLPSTSSSTGGGPSPQQQGKEYSEGGALFAVGLVNAGRGGEECEWLVGQMKAAEDEVVKHGAALGLGVAGMASGSEEIYDILRETLFQDSAVAGEASGYAMGLVMLGSGSTKCFDEMVQYAHETQHEKIIRGLALGMAFLWYGREEEADSCIAQLAKDKDAILRYGAMYTIALAYAGTSNNAAIRQLLDVAVSDVSDDVRRAAVSALGFVLCRSPGQVPRIVQLLSESYNPHVRQGAAVALGVACAGTGLEEAVELLEPMTKDPVDFVRQAALMSLAMVLIQQSAAQNPAVTSVRQKFAAVIADKHEDSMAKFGAALAQGIIDAGGRNVTVSLLGRNGMKSMNAVVGMALFCQFWYWFPLAHCLSLGFAPTALIGLDKDLKIPKFDFISNARPSLYAYPPALKVKEKEEAKPIATAVLSTTAKANARAQEKKKEKEGEAMDTDEAIEVKETEKMDEDATEATPLLVHADDDASTVTAAAAAAATTAPSATAAAGPSKKSAAGGPLAAVTEPPTERRPNMSRVTPAQAAVVGFSAQEATYLPIRADLTGSHPSSSSTTAGGRLAGGRSMTTSTTTAGILMVARHTPARLSSTEETPNMDDEEEEASAFIELEKSLDAVGPAVVVSSSSEGGDAGSQPSTATAGGDGAAGIDDVVMRGGGGGGGGDNDDDGPERDPPASFEYPFN